MRYYLLFFVSLFYAVQLIAQPPMITEISYDNNYDQDDPFGIDSIEYVEVYINNPQPADLSTFVIVAYDPVSGDNSSAEMYKSRDLTTTLRTEATPNGMYYVVEFQDSTFFGFPIGGLNDGMSGIALVEEGTPNIVHQFWRYETCDPFTAIDGPANGAISSPITQDFSRICGSPGVSLVQMNSALSTFVTLQQNGFGDWELDGNSSREFPLENSSNVPVELLHFKGKLNQSSVDLEWATISEVDNDYFEVKHSTNGKNFKTITQVDGVGQSTELESYGFIHREPEFGYNYYRLIQHDYDGKTELVGSIIIKNDSPNTISLYPSAASDKIFLEGIENKGFAEIFSINGNLVSSQYVQNNSLQISELRTGLYFVKINNQVLRFSKI